MAKKKGKVIFWGLVIGAAAAGAYHYLQNKEKAAIAEEFDDFDNFEDDLDDSQTKGRHYVPLNLDNAKAFVSNTIDKAKEAVSKVSKKLQKEDTEDDVIIDDIFDDSADDAADTGGSADTSDAKASGDAPAGGSTEDFFDDGQ